MNKVIRFFISTLILFGAVGSVTAQSIVYDGLSAGTTFTFTGSVPRTYMGQGFSISDPGGNPAISQIRVALVAGAAVNYPATRIRVSLWDIYDATQTGANLVFANQLGGGPINFITTAITTTGATAFIFTLNFATPIPLTGLLNHGITFNWQSDAAGTGTFIDDTLLTTALRGAGSPALTLGANNNPLGGYFRNASGETSFNFRADSARNIANVGGLAFEITAVAIPEPTTWALIGLSTVGGLAVIRRQRRRNQAALEQKLEKC